MSGYEAAKFRSERDERTADAEKWKSRAESAEAALSEALAALRELVEDIDYWNGLNDGTPIDPTAARRFLFNQEKP